MPTLNRQQFDDIMKKAPQGTDPKGVFEHLKSKGYEFVKDSGTQPSAQPPGVSQGMFPKQGRIAESIGDIGETAKGIWESGKERLGKIQEGAEATVAGKQTMAETMFQGAGQALGFAGDVVGQGIMGAGKLLLSGEQEEAVKGGVQKGIQAFSENLPEVTNAIKFFKGEYDRLKTENPRAARNASAALGVLDAALTVAGGGAAKKGIGVAAKGAEEGLSLAGKGLKATAGAIKGGAEAVGEKGIVGLVKAPFQAGEKVLSKGDELIEKATRKLLTSTEGDTAKLARKAIAPTAGMSKKTLADVDKSIQTLNEYLVSKGVKPASMVEYRDASKKALNDFWKEKIQPALESKGTTEVDLRPVAKELRDLAESKTMQTVGKGEDIKKLANNMEKNKYTMMDAEELKQYFNSEAAWGEASKTTAMKGAYKKASLMIGEYQDRLISKMPGEFSALKKQWGQMKEAYDHIVHRANVVERKAPLGLQEGLSRAEGVAKTIGGVLTGKIGQSVEGLAQTALGRSAKFMNDPDFMIKTVFEEMAKKQPGLASKAMPVVAAERIPADEFVKAPATMELSAPPTQAAIGTGEKVKLGLPKSAKQETIKRVYLMSIANEDMPYAGIKLVEGGKLKKSLVNGRIQDVINRLGAEGVDVEPYKKFMKGKEFKDYFEFDKANREILSKMMQ